MPFAQFSTDTYNRVGYGIPQSRLVNMYVEPTLAGPGNQARICRPGLVKQYGLGSGPIKGIFWYDGVVGSHKYTVSGTTFYKDQTAIGSVASGDRAYMDGSGTQLGIVIGGQLYCYDGTTLTHVQYFDDGTSPLPPFSGIVYAAGRFYLTVTNSDQFDWCAIADLTSINALSFATAESEPDPNRQIAAIADEVWFFGTETVEPWYQTGDADAPLQRSQGRRFEKGCAAQASVVAVDNTLFFLGSDALVYRSGQVPVRVSTHGVEAMIKMAADITTCHAYLVSYAGHAFYVLNIPGVTTFAYDVAMSQWSEWTSYDQANFIASCGVMINGVPYLGSALDGSVYTLSDAANDDDGQPITCLASARIPVPTGKAPHFVTMLQSNRGLGATTGTYTDPVVEMRYSDDQGRTWSGWRQAGLGKQGQYSFKAIWRGRGLLKSPGREMEFRVTDPVPIVFEYVQYNEARP